ARPRRDPFSVRARDALRGSRDERGGHGRARCGARPLPARDGRPHRALSSRAGRRGHRLSALEHRASAGAGAAVVSLDAGESALMLTFLSPFFLVGAAAVAVPIVLHLLKREPEPRVKFAAVRMLKRAPVENTERHRLRELLLLALRIAALVLLALAFARPFLPASQAAGASAGTVGGAAPPDRLPAARRVARAATPARSAI